MSPEDAEGDAGGRCDFAHVYEQFDAPLRRFVAARVGDADAAADILQDIYLRIHARLETLRDCRALPGWLFQIARHTVIDHLRSRRPAGESTEDLPAPEDADGDDEIRELARGLAPMIEELPGKYREALVLTLYRGLTQQDLSRHLGISLSGAKSRVQRARDLLKDRLLECCHFELDRRGGIIGYQERCCCCARDPAGPAGRSARS
jgi:RNA polymerase sigma-70 factor, ECF subfamily